MEQFTYKYQTLPDGLRLGYIDEGNGFPLVMIHGFTGTAFRHFDMMIEELRLEYRVIAPDLRGYGRSRPPFRDFPLNFFQRDANDVAVLLDHLNCGQVIVFGFSDGGESALLLASSRPDLVRGLVSWGAWGVETAVDLAHFETWLPVDAWGPDRAGWREEIIIDHGLEQFEPMMQGRVEASRIRIASGGDIGLSMAHLIQCPTLLIHGEEEERTHSREIAELLSKIPNSRLEIIADSNHFLQKEKPKQFMELIRLYLAEHLQ